MPIPFPFDFKNPDYIEVFEWRIERYKRILKQPRQFAILKEEYKNNPAQFIIDWGMTIDPRNVDIGQPAIVPFLLFECQEEWVNWFVECWRKRVPGVTDKSREMGVTWLSTCTAATLCLFHHGMSIGFGSRKEEYVDKLGDPKCLLYKVRFFVSHLPPMFRGTWEERKHAPHMRVQFPDTNSIITGEAGDGIGRGDRASIYVVDESAWLPRPELVEASLSQTTNCRHDISTPRGMANPFARKVHNPLYEKRSLHWRQDPRKDQAWYDKKCLEMDDEVVIAQELDLNYSASQEGIVIAATWVQAAVNAHITLGVTPSGIRKAALDVAGQGRDLNAFCGRHGILIEYIESWSGKGSDLYATTQRAVNLATVFDYAHIDFDADGLGEGIRGDAAKINDTFPFDKRIAFEGFQGSGAVTDPEDDPLHKPGTPKDPKKARTNEDLFANRKAQAWWALRRRFSVTHRAVEAKRKGETYDYSPDDIISLSGDLKELQKLIVELSQPTYTLNNVGKILIEKMPDGARSPNLADAVMIAFAPVKKRVRGFFDA